MTLKLFIISKNVIFQLKVVDGKGDVVPVNTQGELCIRGHGVFMGYWDDPDKTNEVIDKSRWYHTG